MKKYLLFYLLLHIAQSISAQKVVDTITSLVDTINIYGKIIDEDENPVPNTLIISHTLDENYYFKRTKSDKNGKFKLSGINPVDKLLFLSESGKAEFENSQSRYLLVKLEKLRVKEIHGSAIQAKRLSERKRIEIKQISRQSGFDEENYEINDAYPGGLNKLYQLLKSKLVYPANAISANIEGLVNVRFTVTKNGKLKNFIIVKDIGYGCAKQVINILKSVKMWYPRAINGIPIQSSISLTVPFKLTE